MKNMDNDAQEIEELSLQEQLDSMKDQWMRAVAETENLRKRFAKEKEDSLKYGITQFAKDILSVSDNLSRALESLNGMEKTDSIKKVIDGVGATAKDLEKTMERYGIKKLEALGMPFDPHAHQAVVETESNDHAPGMVVSVFQEGYMIHDRLLRPAMVALSKKGAEGMD